MIGNAIAGLYGVGVTPSTTAYESIATTTVGSGGSASITFSSIPSTYTHLQVRYTSRSDSAGINQTLFRINSDTGSNYSSHLLYGDGSGVAAGSYTTDNYSRAGLQGGPSLTTGIFGVGVIDILDYKNANKYKTIRTLSGIDANGSGYVWYTSSNWRSTSAITSLTFFSENGNFIQNAQYALYGIKGA